MQIIELDPDKRFIQDFVSLSKIDNNIDINIDATVIEILPEDDIPKEETLIFVENFFTSNGFEKTSENSWLCKKSNVICNVIHE